MRIPVLLLCLLFLGRAAAQELTVPGAGIRVDVDAADFQAGAAPLLEWIRRSADIVSRYYDRFPATTLHVRVIAEPGGGVRSGKTFGLQGGSIRVQVGRAVTRDELLNDWVLVHEMTHLALPEVGDEHAWLSEGLAVYIEGVARVQAGNRTQSDVWAEEIRSMPRGLPQAGDGGLDRTHTWGRTYWGGAMFCLLADVEIHRRTQNRLGLQDAMRAVLRASGGLSTQWPIERVLRTGDAAVQAPVLEELYAQMKDTPVTPDLTALWHKLGVEPDARLTEDAPWAAVRLSIMQSRGGLTPAKRTSSSPP